MLRNLSRDGDAACCRHHDFGNSIETPLRRDCPILGKRDEQKGGVKLASVSISNTVTAPEVESEAVFVPLHAAQVAGNPVLSLRDTGADVIFVDRKVVPHDAPLLRWSDVVLADGTMRHDPVVLIDVECPFFSGLVEAVVLDKSLRPLIIGNRVTFADGNSYSMGVYPAKAVCGVIQTRTQEEHEKKKKNHYGLV